MPDPTHNSQPAVRILAIDDHADNLTALKAILTDAMPDAQVLTATSGPTGLDLAISQRPDVILLDWVMPEMHGLTVCRALKADVTLQHIPVIILTALRTDRASRMEAVQAGAEAFLSKPIDEVELVAQIRAMVKIKAAGDRNRQEKERLAWMVQERTQTIVHELAERRKAEEELALANQQLRLNQAAMLNLLEDLKAENAARRRTEEALRESEVHYRTLADSGQAMVWTAGLDKKCNYFNQVWLRFTGRTPAQEQGDGWTEGVHPDDRASCFEIYVNAFEQRIPFSMTYRLRRHDGEYRWIIDEGSPRYDGKGEFIGYIGHCLDITERKKAEDELTRARDAAQQASRAKSQFLATMSHELRTPLNPILGFADLLAESPNLTDEQRLWLRIITQRGQDLLGLIGSVLDMAKIEASKITINREPLALRQTVRDLADSVLPAAGKKGLQLTFYVAPELPDDLLADGFRLRQVLLNLLNNAIKFTERGQIEIRVDTRNSAPVTREPAANEVALMFSVQDTGIGIAADRQSAIFEAFTHANQNDAVKYGGAGLGLAIAWRLVEMMGGRIWAESTPGQGSVFKFTMLAGVNTVMEVPGSAETAGRPPVGGAAPLDVLIVEDDPTSLKMTELLVRKAGHRVRSATHGKEALTLTETEHFDLVLMDIQMPVMDGVEATRLIREREAAKAEGGNVKHEERAEGGSLRPEMGDTQVSGLNSQVSGLSTQPSPHVRIIALTAYAMQGDCERFLKAGMDGYLSKPIVAAQLRELLKSIEHLSDAPYIVGQ